MFFIAFRLDSILNKQKIIIPGKNGQNSQFLAKSQNFQLCGQEKKKKSIQKFLEKIKFNENHR
jgi:hypothetical protein